MSQSTDRYDQEGLHYLMLVWAELEKLNSAIHTFVSKIAGCPVDWLQPTTGGLMEFTPAGVEIMLCEIVKHLKLFKNYSQVVDNVRKLWVTFRTPFGFESFEETKAKAAESTHDYELAKKIRGRFQEETEILFNKWEMKIFVVEGILAFSLTNEKHLPGSMSGLPYFLKEIVEIISESQLAAFCMYQRCIEAIPAQYRIEY